jgi:copper homeostasis protein
MPALLEIAATTVADAQRAQTGGAHSIEISQNLAAGGLTPPFERVQQIRDAVTLEIHVILRPHARDFTYSPAEIAVILAEAGRLAKIGVDGVVFGAHTPDHELDVDLIQAVKEAASPLTLTVHRALDTCAHPDHALQALVGSVPRILTSGPADNAWSGRHNLRRWRETYDFHFVASGGLRMDQLADYATLVQVQAYHFGRAARTDDAVDVAKVRQLAEIIAEVSA